MIEFLNTLMTLTAVIISAVALSTWRKQFKHDLVHKLMGSILTLEWHVRSLVAPAEGGMDGELEELQTRWGNVLNAQSDVRLALAPCRAKWGENIETDVNPIFKLLEIGGDLRYGLKRRIESLSELVERDCITKSVIESIEADCESSQYVNLEGNDDFENAVKALRDKYLVPWYQPEDGSWPAKAVAGTCVAATIGLLCFAFWRIVSV